MASVSDDRVVAGAKEVKVGDTEPLLSVEEARKYYPLDSALPWSRPTGYVHAVDGVSLSVRFGETLSLVGESGCGKTTLARIILKLEQLDAGALRFKRTDITHLKGPGLREYRASVQAVFQDPWGSLNPKMRVRDTVAEPLIVNTNLRGRFLESRVAELLDSVGLDPATAGNFPHEFSGGQRQRIAVARAISLKPDLIVLDEPVSALDVSIRAQILNLLKDLQGKLGASYLMIAHDLATVRYLSHRVAVMYLGEIVETATAEAIFRRPMHPYTRALISAAEFDRDDHDAGKIILSGDVPSAAHPPSGCRFHSRCWLYERLGRPDQCRSEKPVARETSAEQLAACHFSEELPETAVPAANTDQIAPGEK